MSNMTFQASAQTFQRDNALVLAQFSKMAYQSAEEIRAALGLQDDDTSRFAFIEAHSPGYDTECFVLADNTAVLLVFRGTEPNSLEDWVSNLDNRLYEIWGGGVHQGFWEALSQVWDEILMRLSIYRDTQQPVWIAGHSQGGALAMLAARRLYDAGIVPQGIYTFGQPKVGDVLFVSNYEALLGRCTFRVYHEADSVPNNPPQLYHAGVGVRLRAGGGYTLEEEHNFLLSSSSGFGAVLDALFDFTTGDMQAHYIDSYLRCLEQS